MRKEIGKKCYSNKIKFKKNTHVYTSRSFKIKTKL